MTGFSTLFRRLYGGGYRLASWKKYPDDFLDRLGAHLGGLGVGFYDVTHYGAIADSGTTDNAAAIALAAAEAGNYGLLYFPPHADGAYYGVASLVTFTKPVVVMGSYNLSDSSAGGKAIQSRAGTCRVVFSDAAAGFKWQSATAGGILWGSGVYNIRLSGTAAGAAVASKGIHAVDVSGFGIDNVSCERFTTAGVHLDAYDDGVGNPNGVIGSYNWIGRYRYNYGNNAVAGENSDGVLLGNDHSTNTIGLTHTEMGMLNGAVRDGHMLKVQGNVDSFQAGRCHASVAGSGGVVELANNAVGSRHPRRGHFGLVAGRPFVVGSNCTSHVIEHYNYDGTTAVLSEMFTVASGGEVRATIVDNTGSFNVHYGKRLPTVASAATLALPDTVEDFCDVTGTTNITSITAVPALAGKTVRLRFADTLTVSDGNNLKLSEDFSATADDILTLFHDGTNWFQAPGNN